MNAVISLRGTHGSGKSTLMRKFMKRYNAEPHMTRGEEEPAAKRNRDRPVSYECDTPWGNVYVIGPYETECGGCDALQPYTRIWELIRHHMPLGHVLFEGALVSSSFGSIGRSMENLPGAAWATMDTPPEQCIENIMARRAGSGREHAPLKPDNTINKHRSCLRVVHKVEELGLRHKWIRFNYGMRDLTSLLAEIANA